MRRRKTDNTGINDRAATQAQIRLLAQMLQERGYMADLSSLTFHQARDLIAQLRHSREPGWSWEYPY